jgi:hypothetical protein
MFFWHLIQIIYGDNTALFANKSNTIVANYFSETLCAFSVVVKSHFSNSLSREISFLALGRPRGT